MLSVLPVWKKFLVDIHDVRGNDIYSTIMKHLESGVVDLYYAMAYHLTGIC